MSVQNQIYFGPGTHRELKGVLANIAPRKVLFVTGKGSYAASGAKDLLDPILKEFACVTFSDFENNPKLKDIQKGVALFKHQECDAVVGVGGGSVLDTAKAIALLSTQQADQQAIVEGKIDPKARTVPLVLLPTTAGTGSEATRFSVVNIEKNKFSLTHDSMRPDVAIMDPLLIRSLPAYVAATTGMDALCQAIEGFWSIHSTDASRDFSREAIKLILPNIEKAVNQADEQAQANMLWASHVAGKAIDIAKTTIAHAVSYPMTGYFNIAHGHAVALTLPAFIEFNEGITDKDINDPRGLDFVKKTIAELLALLSVSSGKQAKDKLYTLMENIHLTTKLSKLGVNAANLNLIVDNGFNPQRARNNPRRVEKTDLENILRTLL